MKRIGNACLIPDIETMLEHPECWLGVLEHEPCIWNWFEEKLERRGLQHSDYVISGVR